MFCFAAKWRKMLSKKIPLLLLLLLLCRCRLSCRNNHAEEKTCTQCITLHIILKTMTSIINNNRNTNNKRLTIGWGMRISVLSPSFSSFSTFCPATDWKLIFTMSQCGGLSAGLCLCYLLLLVHLLCLKTRRPAPRRRAVLFSPLGCFSLFLSLSTGSVLFPFF